MIWKAIESEEALKLELYKVFQEIVNKLRPSDVSFIIYKLSQVPIK
jgi:hypothetical protein